MIRFPIFVAGLLSGVTALAHVVSGGPEFLDVALASPLPLSGKAMYAVIWHFVSAYLALSVVVLVRSLTRAGGERALVSFICVLSIAFGTLFFVTGIIVLGSPFVLLQWTVFGVIAALLGLALWRWASQPRVDEVAVMPDHIAHLPQSDFADAYAAQVAHRGDALAQARAILSVQPRWVAVLMALRNAVVAPFGLIRSTKTKVQGRDHVGFFPVLSAEADRAVLGLNDSHLDFRLLVDVAGEGEVQRVVLTTLVHTHNWLGRVYMFFVKPFHRAIVITLLHRAAISPKPEQNGANKGQKQHRVLQ